MDQSIIEALWVHGGLALAAGLVILLFPKIFFLLIGGFLVLSGAVAIWHGPDILPGLAVVLAGVLIFLSPGLVAWFLSFYLLLAAVFVAVTGVWFLAIPVLLMAFLVLLLPKLLPALVGIFLVLGGGLSLAATFLGAG